MARLFSPKRFALIAAVVVLLFAVAFGSLFYLNSQIGFAGKVEKIFFGDLSVDSSELVYIAENQQFFAKNGLNVTMKNYDTGPAAVEAMMRSEVDMTSSGEYPFVAEALAKENISIIGTMDRFQAFYLIARKDRGIENISNLGGKNIGAVRKTLMEFYLGRFLDLHDMNIRNVSLVDVKPSQWVDSITNGTVDGVVVSQAYVSQIHSRLGNGIIVWPLQSNQLAYGIIFCRNNWITQHPELVNRFLKSLAEAEEYLTSHLGEAKAILQNHLHYSDAYVAEVWPMHRFFLSLDQSLVVAMEDESRWMINNNLTSATEVPNFMNHIYLDGLIKVKPESVNIIR